MSTSRAIPTIPTECTSLEEPIMLLKSIPAAADRVRTFAELAALVMFAALITVFVEYGIPYLVQ
jgi:hypothetical protein